MVTSRSSGMMGWDHEAGNAGATHDDTSSPLLLCLPTSPGRVPNFPPSLPCTLLTVANLVSLCPMARPSALFQSQRITHTSGLIHPTQTLGPFHRKAGACVIDMGSTE